MELDCRCETFSQHVLDFFCLDWFGTCDVVFTFVLRVPGIFQRTAGSSCFSGLACLLRMIRIRKRIEAVNAVGECITWNAHGNAFGRRRTTWRWTEMNIRVQNLPVGWLWLSKRWQCQCQCQCRPQCQCQCRPDTSTTNRSINQKTGSLKRPKYVQFSGQ